MKIYMNSVSINLDLSEFLGILESNSLDDLILVITELDDVSSEKAKKAAPKKPTSLPKQIMNSQELYGREEYEIEDFDALLAAMQEQYPDSHIEVIEYEVDYDGDEDGLEDFLRSLDLSGEFEGDLDESKYMVYTTYNEEEEGLSNEDRKVRRLLNLYKYTVE